MNLQGCRVQHHHHASPGRRQVQSARCAIRFFPNSLLLAQEKSVLFGLSIVMVRSVARFAPFAGVRIVGKAEEVASRQRIRKQVLKNDGRRATLQAIGGILNHACAGPAWQGRDSAAGGRPQEFDDAEVLKLKKVLHDDVGLAKFNMPCWKRRLPFLRPVSMECLRQTLKRLGFAWRLWRARAAIGKKCRPGRLDWGDWVRKQAQNMVSNLYAFSTQL